MVGVNLLVNLNVIQGSLRVEEAVAIEYVHSTEVDNSKRCPGSREAYHNRGQFTLMADY